MAAGYLIFDYIIVGAGSAGSVLANRLSASGRDSVLLLEAGPSDRRFYVRMPMGYGKVYYQSAINWKYETEPVPGLNNQSSYWPRGKVLGGSSSINAMVYVRGHPIDYEQWNSVARGWDWNQVRPVFKNMENWSDGADEHRGEDGLLSVTNIKNDAHPLCQTYLDAAQQCQIPLNPDYNGSSMEGATLYQINTRNGLRASASACYLQPAMNRKNLKVKTSAQVTRLQFENLASGALKASGVDFTDGQGSHHAKAHKEIILSGGAINSPQLLQLSGIGPAHLLKRFDIPIVKDNAHVGQHLQDHLGADLVCRTHVPTLNQDLGPWYGKLKAGLEFLFKRSGPLTLSLNQAGGFVSLNSTQSPELQLYFSPVSYTRAPPGTRPLISPDPFPGFLIGFNPCKPTSRGYLELQSPDPLVAPKLQPNYLDTEHDRQLMLDGLELVRKITAAPAFKSVIEKELLPGADCESEADLMEHIRNTAWTVFHQCGTCRMGDNAGASVVDARLRVHGTEGLRVADASVFPTIPTGNTNAPSIMVGERASEFILQDQNN